MSHFSPRQVQEMLALNVRAEALARQGAALVATVSGAWRQLHRPLQRLLQRLRSVLQGDRLQRLFSLAKAWHMEARRAT